MRIGRRIINGETFASLANEVGVSGPRIRQILDDRSGRGDLPEAEQTKRRRCRVPPGSTLTAVAVALRLTPGSFEKPRTSQVEFFWQGRSIPVLDCIVTGHDAALIKGDIQLPHVRAVEERHH